MHVGLGSVHKPFKNEYYKFYHNIYQIIIIISWHLAHVLTPILNRFNIAV